MPPLRLIYSAGSCFDGQMPHITLSTAHGLIVIGDTFSVYFNHHGNVVAVV